MHAGNGTDVAPDPARSNGAIANALWAASLDHDGHRRRALRRASSAARLWPEEAAALAGADRPLTELPGVGPWIAAIVEEVLAGARAAPRDPLRDGFLTFADVRRVLDGDPSWESLPHGDLQVHSTDSDGRVPLEQMVDAARDAGRSFVAITDHSERLTIANGMDRDRLVDQGRRIRSLDRTMAPGFRVLRGIEMDVLPDGSADLSLTLRRTLDLVLGAFHSDLRSSADPTERYLRAVRLPAVHVLAHPTTRMFGRRPGLRPDWRRVFAEAARLGKAIELDATVARQDLTVELAGLALEEGVQWFSIGSDAHAPGELAALPFGMAVAALAGIPRERILNYLDVTTLLEVLNAMA